MQRFYPSRSFRASFYAVLARVVAVAALALLCVSCGANVCVSFFSNLGITPSSVKSGGATFTLTVNGTGFTPSMQVLVNGNDRPFQFVNSSQILVIITSGDIATPGIVRIVVQSGSGTFTCRTGSSSALVTVT